MADLARNQASPLTRGPGSESYPSASPDGNHVVFGTGDPDYDVVEVPAVGGGTRPVLATAGNESSPVWSPDGNLFAYVTDRSWQEEIWLRSRDGRAGRGALS